MNKIIFSQLYLQISASHCSKTGVLFSPYAIFSEECYWHFQLQIFREAQGIWEHSCYLQFHTFQHLWNYQSKKEGNLSWLFKVNFWNTIVGIGVWGWLWGMVYFFQYHCPYTSNFLMVSCYLYLLPNRKMPSEHQPYKHQSWNAALESMNLCCFRLKILSNSSEEAANTQSSICGLALGSVEPSFTTVILKWLYCYTWVYIIYVL